MRLVSFRGGPFVSPLKRRALMRSPHPGQAGGLLLVPQTLVLWVPTDTEGDLVRIAFLTNNQSLGVRHKYIRMFEKVARITPVKTGRLDAFDAVIVTGYRCQNYRKALAARKPYLLIQHDTVSLWRGKPSKAEQTMIERAAGVVFNSEHHRDQLTYDLPPHWVVHPRPVAQDLDFDPLPKLPGKHLAYSGSLGRPKTMRAYHDIFRTMLDAGWAVHLYPAWGGRDPERLRPYRTMGCTVHTPVPQHSIYRELSQYTVGFQGYAPAGNQDYIDGCMPNKLWEYLGAGIPTVGYNTGKGGAVYDGEWGLVAPTLVDLPATAEAASLIDVGEHRAREVIDADISAFKEMVACLSRKCADARRARASSGRIRP